MIMEDTVVDRKFGNPNLSSLNMGKYKNIVEVANK